MRGMEQMFYTPYLIYDDSTQLYIPKNKTASLLETYDLALCSSTPFFYGVVRGLAVSSEWTDRVGSCVT